MITLTALYIYPIKGLGGISLPSATVTPRGLQYDRRYMLVDMQGKFLTQRSLPRMALLKTALHHGHMLVHGMDDSTLELPLQPAGGEEMQVEIWKDHCLARSLSPQADHWFSLQLQTDCRLVYMPDDSKRPVDPAYARTTKDITSFSDGYPFLVISEASLEDLNRRLETPVPMNRFRPNLVIRGVDAYAEDDMKSFTIRGVRFFGVKRCGRCAVPTINQDTAEKGQEPMRTLATYRTIDQKVCFGQNLLVEGDGEIIVGDSVTLPD